MIFTFRFSFFHRTCFERTKKAEKQVKGRRKIFSASYTSKSECKDNKTQEKENILLIAVHIADMGTKGSLPYFFQVAMQTSHHYIDTHLFI
ncbi:hypothetical protein DDZ16_12625 [Marinilabilia rubra]|uniref:Uncharacterized protein n=1 Tax=Marinilabilia rubra TaxID=2162893 RepID=A0A2U2B7S2_9BACT|nr:hypothetical protein DDZ16_12625 [Marinilabilia rubra]